MTGPSVFGVAAPNIELAGMITLDNNLDGIVVRKNCFLKNSDIIGFAFARQPGRSVVPLADLWCS